MAQTRQLVNDIESVAKTEQATDEMPVSLISLETVLDKVKAQLQEKFKEADFTISTNFSAAPAAWFSEKKLQNLLTTLLTPILKAEVANRPTEITLTSKFSGGFTIVTAQSNWPVATDLQTQLTPKLNFYLVQREISQLGGRLEFGNGEADHTLFRIYLRKPLTNILLVDEDETTNFLNKRLLARLVNGLDVTTKTSASEALTYLQETGNQVQDLIFIDLKTAVQGSISFLEKFDQLKLQGLPLPEVILMAPSTGSKSQEPKQYPFIRETVTSPLTEENINHLLQEFLAV